jgi:proton-dependent oligopeptide transporter, POT family
MAKAAPRTSPDHQTSGWPPGVPYIIGNEGCERFSFYGMRSILTLYLARELYVRHPELGSNAEAYAQSHYHLFVAAVYAFPLLGAVVADKLLGKYQVILYLSLVYCAGHACLAMFEGSVWGIWTGLGLIAIGSGGIKPCVSANVGDQFGRNNWFRVRTIFQAFYFIINFGSFFSTLLIPWLWDKFGASVAFGVPGILMAIATLIFWMGRDKFVQVPASPGGKLGLIDSVSAGLMFLALLNLLFVSAPWYTMLAVTLALFAAGLGVFVWRNRIQPDDGFLAVLLYSLGLLRSEDRSLPQVSQPASAAVSPEIAESRRKLAQSSLFGPAVKRFGIEAAEGPVAVLKIISVFILVSIFWALFDQHGSSWILQAEQMDRKLELVLFGWTAFSITPNASQVQALNPLLVMLLIPFANGLFYPGVEKLGFKATPLRRMTTGMIIASSSFVAVALIQHRLDAGGAGSVHVGWQLLPYVLITLAEVMVSITGLEFAYTQAPRRMKSIIMGFWLLAVTLGNKLVAVVSLIKLPPAQFFWVFAGLMLAAGLFFGLRAYFYKQQDYVQE